MPTDASPVPATLQPVSIRLKELAAVFLKLGTVAFGGPAAHIAMMEDEVVRRRQWLTSAEFLDMLGATNLIPGPNSTEMSLHIGYHRAGIRGLVVAGCSFIMPAVAIVLCLAWIYVRFRTLPAAEALLYGIKPVIIAIVVQALWRLARTAVRTRFLAMVGIVSVVASLAGAPELLVLFAGATFVAVFETVAARRRTDTPPPALFPGLLLGMSFRPAAAASAAVAAAGSAGIPLTPPGLLPIFGIFLKIGSVLFGSGYVLLAFLRSDLVERLHWMSEAQLLDAVAVGQITPGPLFTTATFIGYVLAGPGGAAAATVGIFLPAFFFVGVTAPLVTRMRQSPAAGRFLDGVNVTSLALMAVVTWQLFSAAVTDLLTVLLAAGSALLLFRFQVNSLWLLLGGAAAGLLAGWAGVR